MAVLNCRVVDQEMDPINIYSLIGLAPSDGEQT